MPDVNPYAQDLQPPSAAIAQGRNPYADDIADKKQATIGSVALNAGAGADSGLYSTLGAPIDAAAWAMNRGLHGVNALAGTNIPDIKNPIGGSQFFKNAFTSAGVPDPDSIEANTPVERIARATGEGAGSMVTGAGMGAGLMKLASATPQAFSVMESVLGKPNLGTAAVGAASGAGAQAAAEVAPDGYKTGAAMVGGLVGGALPLGARVVYEGGKFAVNAAKDFSMPFTKTGQDALAGSRIADAASDVNAVKNSLQNGPREIVPGSQPTTFQQTGDMGLGQLERSVRTQSPDDFIQRGADQNSARQASIQGVQATGSPAEVSAHFRTLRNTLDSATEASVNQARQGVNQATAAMGGSGNAEMYGAAMREPAQAARDAAKATERQLWDAVDPDNSLTMPGTPIANSAKSIQGMMTPSAKPLDGEEAAIFGVARSYGDQTPFRDVTDLRSRLSAAMSDELRNSGRTPTYARLSTLKGAVENTIDRAVENQARLDNVAVAKGQMAPEDTFAAKMQQEVNGFYARRNSALADRGSGAGAVSASGPSSAVGDIRAAGQTGGRSGLAPGNPGLSQTGAPLDPAAAQRLRDASAATRERAQTFDEGATGSVLKPGSRSGDYRTPDSLVPSKVFHPGANGGEDVRHYINAVGEDHAVPTIADYAAFSLRKAAMRPDGSIDTAKALGWAKQHDAALAELPASVRNRLANPGRAEEAVAQATARRKDMLHTFDHSALAHVMSTDSGDVVRQIGSVFNSRDAASRMEDLARAANSSPAAKAGLRRAIVEHIQSQYLSNAEAGTTGAGQMKSDAFQTFMRTKSDVLGKVFTPEEIGTLRAVAQDLQRANRSINATKLAGGSNTAQDTHALGNQTGTILNHIAVEGAAAAAGHAIANTGGGIAGWLGVRAASALRDAGLSNVDQLVKEAMLNPELARALLQKVPAKPDTGASVRIASLAKRIAIAGPMIGATSRQ